ncbi:thermostable hemolysin [Halomonas getboli]|uniref:thermostable hemolysin n=1 Tax=Halomonas getboli TaxID=2935862 RepID=UPI001FFF9033|nr:thermostable hemolysin [Halomonas getboli]MCK2185182.1 thermostable hemolysin [Halomonas getboli]
MSLTATRSTAEPPIEWREARHWSERRQLEQLVSHCFATQHDARISQYLPRLFGLWQQEHPVAAVGVRRADEGRLFQEGYLEAPAEACMTQALGTPIARGHIAEIGNLVSTRRGLQRVLFPYLIDQLAGEGLHWVLFTAIPAVINGIRRLGIELMPLRLADPAWLGEEREAWGHYYDQHPWVMAGDLRLARERLRTAGLLSALREDDHVRPA